MTHLTVRRADGIALIVMGFVLVAVPIAAHVNLRRVHERDLDGIMRLRQMLDSTRVMAGQTGSPVDSLRLTKEIEARERGVARREYHVPLRAASLERWWRPGGGPTWLVAAGMLLVAGGAIIAHRHHPSRGRSP